MITDKALCCTARKDIISRLCSEIAQAKSKVVLVHGAGSFGHVKAKRYALDLGMEEKDKRNAIMEVQMDVRQLNHIIMQTLYEHGIWAVSIPPSATVLMEDCQIVSMDMNIINAYLAMDIVPVTFGDVVIDRKRGVAICSGDALMEYLAIHLNPVEKVPLPDRPSVTVDYKHLLTLERKGVKTFIPPGIDKEYSVSQLLGSIFVELPEAEKGMTLVNIERLVIEKSIVGSKILGSEIKIV